MSGEVIGASLVEARVLCRELSTEHPVPMLLLRPHRRRGLIAIELFADGERHPKIRRMTAAEAVGFLDDVAGMVGFVIDESLPLAVKAKAELIATLVRSECEGVA